MNNQTAQQCAICSQQPEDMLILTCSHNLCLDCATELFTATSQRNSLQCQICLANTPLDRDTVRCLEGLQTSFSSPVAEPIQVDIPRPPKTKKDIGCSQHNEKAVYFCFDCQDGSICSECILEGAHNGHSVMTIKRSSKVLTDKIVQNSRELQMLRMQMNQRIDEAMQFKEVLMADKEERQQNLRILFDNMIRQVTDKYNELNHQIDTMSQRSIEIVEGTLNVFNQKISFIIQAIRQNQNVVERHEEKQILKRYSEIERKKISLEADLNIVFPKSLKDYHLSYDSSCCSDLDSLLDKLSWKQTSELRHIQKQNKQSLFNSIAKQGSILIVSPQRSKGYSQHSDFQSGRDCTNSDSKHQTGNRKLQLSRSMNNATNIINRLQQRVRR